MMSPKRRVFTSSESIETAMPTKRLCSGFGISTTSVSVNEAAASAIKLAHPETAMAPSPLGTLGNLPGEIRNMIYSNLVPAVATSADQHYDGGFVNLLCLSRQIHREVSSLPEVTERPLTIFADTEIQIEGWKFVPREVSRDTWFDEQEMNFHEGLTAVRERYTNGGLLKAMESFTFRAPPKVILDLRMPHDLVDSIKTIDLPMCESIAAVSEVLSRLPNGVGSLKVRVRVTLNEGEYPPYWSLIAPDSRSVEPMDHVHNVRRPYTLFRILGGLVTTKVPMRISGPATVELVIDGACDGKFEKKAAERMSQVVHDYGSFLEKTRAWDCRPWVRKTCWENWGKDMYAEWQNEKLSEGEEMEKWRSGNEIGNKMPSMK